MADGFGGTAEGVDADAHAPGRLSAAVKWLFGSRTGLLSVWTGFAGLALAGAAYAAYAAELTFNIELISYFLAASALFFLPLLLLLADPEASMASGPGLKLPIATTLLLLALTVFAIVDQQYFHLLNEPAPRLAFLAALTITFAARVFNAALFAAFKSAKRKAAEKAAEIEARSDVIAQRGQSDDVDKKIREYRSAESVGAFAATLLVAGIIASAYWAGSFPTDPALGASLGVGVFIVVISIFAIVLCIDWLSDAPFVRQMSKWTTSLAVPGRGFAQFYDFIDGGLVHIGGHVAGADHLQARSRYIILASTLMLLATMGWFLPAPFGLTPVLIGLVVGLSVSRLWSWVEEDRNFAAITQFSPKAPQRIGFREDFRDETLLGFIFVLALIPIGMMQLHQSNLLGGPLFANVTHPERPIHSENFFVWLGYFGFELAKALPIVDWADIYHLGPGSDSIVPTRPLGMHAVFGARVLVDLLLIAALLQAVGIASRNRQQKLLFAGKHIDRLDELVEKHELSKAIRLCLLPQTEDAAPLFSLPILGKSEVVDFRIYNEARLRAIFLKDSRPEVRGFILQIFKERGISPEPAMVTVQDIAASHRNEVDLVLAFEEAKREHVAEIYKITLEDITTVLFELRASSGMREFKFELISYAERIGTAARYLDLLTTVSVGPGEDNYIYTRRRAAETILRIAPQITDREALLAALAAYEQKGPQAFGSARQIWNDVTAALRQQIGSI